jgi:hypothetical protein
MEDNRGSEGDFGSVGFPGVATLDHNGATSAASSSFFFKTRRAHRCAGRRRKREGRACPSSSITFSRLLTVSNNAVSRRYWMRAQGVLTLNFDSERVLPLIKLDRDYSDITFVDNFSSTFQAIDKLHKSLEYLPKGHHDDLNDDDHHDARSS